MKRHIKQLIAALGYEVRGTRMTPRLLREPQLLRELEFDDVVCRRMCEGGNRELKFIQIGAFDGILEDPLRKYIDTHGWRGVLVEPQPGPAGRLRELYKGNDRVSVLEAAIAAEAGVRAFFAVDSPEAPAWAGALASFDRSVILRHAGALPGVERMIKETTVNCITFDRILDETMPGDVDLLQIDAEGSDAAILALFPFDRVRPAIVHWEVCHLSLRERESCFDRLAPYGYRFAPSGSLDNLAVRDSS